MENCDHQVALFGADSVNISDFDRVQKMYDDQVIQFNTDMKDGKKGRAIHIPTRIQYHNFCTQCGTAVEYYHEDVNGVRTLKVKEKYRV